MRALGFSYHRSGEDPLPHLFERGVARATPYFAEDAKWISRAR